MYLVFLLNTPMDDKWNLWRARIDSWRVIPRVIVALYGYVFYEVVTWYMLLELPNMAQAGFVSTIVGAAALFFNFYVSSGGSSDDK